MQIRHLDSPQASAAKAEYYRAVSKDEGAGTWFRLMRELPDALRFIGPAQTRAGIIRTILFANTTQGRSQLTDQHFREADVEFREFANLEYLTGAKKAVPVVEFHNLRSYYNFCNAVGMSHPPQGFTHNVATRVLLAAMGAHIQEPGAIRPTGILIYCREPIPGAMPPEQIRTHESVHCVDPLLFARESVDELILSELIATIGEFASEEVSQDAALDDYRLNSYPEYWAAYYSRLRGISSDLQKILWPEGDTPRPLTVEALANSTIKFVHDLTNGRKNFEIVRMLMRCLNFKEVHQELCNICPERYRETAVASHDPAIARVSTAVRDGAIEASDPQAFEQVKRLMTHYYGNWPRAYTLEKRTITSLWQEESYARQAMIGFMLGPMIGERALRLLSELSGHQFDTENITDFKVEIEKIGPNYQIRVTW